MITRYENKKDKENEIIVPGLGEYEKIVTVLENEREICNLTSLVEKVDCYFGIPTECDVNTLMNKIITDFKDERDMIVLSGYGHLLLAERLYQEKYNKKMINKQIKKAEALLDFANMGGRHPLLPRTMRLKRRVNWKAYSKLVITIMLLLILICFIAYLCGKIKNLDFDIL